MARHNLLNQVEKSCRDQRPASRRRFVARSAFLFAAILAFTVHIAITTLATADETVTAAAEIVKDEIQPPERVAFDQSFRLALRELAEQCVAQGRDDLGQLTSAWFVPRDPQRLYVFLPPPRDRLEPESDADNVTHQWYTSFREIRAVQAEHLFALAKTAVEEGDGGLACMLLNEVMHENPDHEEARRILGYTLREDGWSRGPKVLDSSTIYRADDLFGWKPGEHFKVATNNFVISTSHSLEEGERLAHTLEKLYAVWQQVFYDYRGSPDILERRFQSDRVSPLDRNRRRFKVALFADRGEYVDILSREVPGIEQTFGYYAPLREESFFYVEGTLHERTWFHETTHQLFQETVRAQEQAASTDGVWALEGVAAFMESLQDHGHYVTLGGFDASWLQYARFRYKNQGFFVEFDELAAMGKSALQASDMIQPLYSQSAGMSHFLMTGANQEHRIAFIEYLELIYREDRRRPDALFRLTHREPQELKEEYDEFLRTDRTDLTDYLLIPEQTRHLVMGFSDVDDDSLSVLLNAKSLEWLDLTATPITDDGLVHLADCHRLTQLFLGGTRITDSGLAVLAKIDSLVELDLVGTRVTSTGIAALRELASLQSMRLTGTLVDDDVIDVLIAMPSLRSVDLSDTNISASSIDELRTARPDLVVETD